MSAPAPATPPEPAEPETPAAPAPHPAQAGLDRDLDRLERLADYGLRIAAVLADRAEAPEADVEAAALAYGRVARAVRLGILLRSKLVEDGQAQERRRRSEAESAERMAGYAEAAEFEAEKAQEAEAKTLARRIIRRVIRAEHRDAETIERLDRETVERLKAEDIYGWISARPMSDSVAEICADLGLSPDWDALGQECWAVEEVRSGDVGDPLKAFIEANPPPDEDDEQLARPPPYTGEGDPVGVEGKRCSQATALIGAA